MTAVNADVKAPGGVDGSGPVLIVEHTTDNALVTFRFKHKDVAMEAAEEEFDAAGRKFRAGSFIVKNANRAVLEPTLTSLGLSAAAVAAAPAVRTHNLDVPRIGYIHSWANTQNEGWVRAAFDTYGVPYTYFADITLREGNLRQKYDVIVYPHVGGSAQSQVNGLPKTERIAAAVQEDRRHAQPRRHRSGGRHPRRHGVGRTDGAGQVRARRRHAHHRRGDVDDLPCVQRQQRRHRREPGGVVRPRVGDARRRSPIGAARSPMATTPRCRSTSTRIRC